MNDTYRWVGVGYEGAHRHLCASDAYRWVGETYGSAHRWVTLLLGRDLAAD
jgi:hypothetical protein